MCASADEKSGVSRRDANEVCALSAAAGRAKEFFAIVTPQLAGSGMLQDLGHADGMDAWVLPPNVFNLDGKESKA